MSLHTTVKEVAGISPEDADATYLRLDGTTLMVGDVIFTSLGQGVVHVVNDGSSDRKYRLVLVWNTFISEPTFKFVEVI